MSKIVTGSQGRIGLPATMSTTASSDISIDHCTKQKMTWEITSVSRANATLRTRDALLSSAFIPRLVTWEKNPHGKIPHNKYSAYTLRPDGSPIGAVAPNTTPKTNV
jgi:hypothetical protein